MMLTGPPASHFAGMQPRSSAAQPCSMRPPCSGAASWPSWADRQRNAAGGSVACPHGPMRFGGAALQQQQQPSRAAVATAALRSGNGEKWWEKETPNMHNVTSVQDLVDRLADAGDNLVIVDFYGPWCGACRALYPKLLKLMEQFPDVVFLKVNFDENKAMCKTLGVKVLPMFHVYHGAQGRVAAFSCTVSKFQRMRDALEEFYTPICSLEDNPGLPEFPEIIPHPNEVTRVAGVQLPSVDERLLAGAAAPAAAAVSLAAEPQPVGVA